LFAGLVARLANEWDGSPQTARSRLGDAGQRARRRRYSRQRLHDVYITVDRALATTDLREIRDAVKQALTGPQDLRDEVSAIRSLGLLLPKRLVRVVDSATTVISSNIVVTDPAATRLDRRTPTASPRGLSIWAWPKR
jgi:hypothetical protein